MLTAQDKETDKDPETGRDFASVNVVNIRVPVRVFHKNKPVEGLKKDDFKIFENGQERPINGFYMERKKLIQPDELATATKSATPAKRPPRLFMLVFNISYPSPELKKALDTFFGTVIQRGDRIISIVNASFLPERIVNNPETEKQRLLKQVNIEMESVKKANALMVQHVRMLVEEMVDQVSNPGNPAPPDHPLRPIKQFILEFKHHYKQAKWKYVQPSLKLYVQLSNYLKEQKSEKWVLSFYQPALFPKGMAMTDFLVSIGSGRRDIMGHVAAFLPSLEATDDWMIKTVAKLFLNSGATFHTLIMNPPASAARDSFMQTDMEHALRNVAKMTGGSVIESHKIDDFVKDIAQKEDIYYVLTFVPGKGTGSNSKIKIKIDKTKYKKHRLVYHNQKKPSYVKKLMARVKDKTPQFKVHSIAVNKGLFDAVVTGIQIVAPSQDEKTKNEKTENKLEQLQCGVEARLTIMDGQGNSCYDQNIKYLCKKPASIIRFNVSKLPPGTYDYILEIKDIVSMKTDVSGANIKIN